MPFNKLQLRRISQVRGQAWIRSTVGNRALRIAETYLRRKLYNLEDQTVREIIQKCRETHQRLRLALMTTQDSALWRKTAVRRAETELSSVAYAVAAIDARAARLAYQAGYWGRLWAMDAALDGIRPRIGPPMPFQIDTEDWTEPYLNEAAASILRIRRLTAQAVADQASRTAQVAAIGLEIGASAQQPRGLFYRLQLLSRSAVMRYANYGAHAAYQAQVKTPRWREAEGDEPDWLIGIMWVSSRDARVCSVCQRLDGKIYIVSDFFGMALTGLPPDASHLGCRCGFMPLILPNVLKGKNEPPDSTFGEWLDAEGILLDGDFVGETGLDSSQVG